MKMNVIRYLLIWTLAAAVPFANAFSSISIQTSLRKSAGYTTRIFSAHSDNDNNDDNNNSEHISSPPTRRDILQTATTLTLATSTLFISPPKSQALDILPPILQPRERRSNGGVYTPAKRSTAYLVDSTIPPTLVPFQAQREAAILKNLGAGLGTSKDPYLSEALTLNNIAKKTVFGSFELVEDLVLRGGKKKDAKGGEGYASFICLGVDYEDKEDEDDAGLAVGLMEDIVKPRKGLDTAVGLEFVPQSCQNNLDLYSKNGDAVALKEALMKKEVAEKVIDRYIPLFKFARSKKLSLLALSPEVEDLQTVRSEGLQSLNLDRRSNYVLDAQGFIALTQDEKFKLYTDRSLLKDFVPSSEKDGVGDYFAERILHHEACASVVSSWAMQRPDSLVVVVAPIKDVRYMGGINGRIPRICGVLNKGSSVDESAVTTILLNPSAEETLSGSRYLRLEIGTAPKNLAYQTKVADYIWFSKMPKVNMLSRMMNPM